MSVLVADPNNQWATKSVNLHDLHNQEHLMKEMEKLISKGLTRFYSGNIEGDEDEEINVT